MARYKTPEERAFEVVEKLTSFIQNKDGITGRLPFKTWQQFAHKEIADTVRECEDHRTTTWRVISLVVTVTFVTLTTIAFWAAISWVGQNVSAYAVLGITAVGTVVATVYVVRVARRLLK